jgi:hypothetical protein
MRSRYINDNIVTVMIMWTINTDIGLHKMSLKKEKADVKVLIIPWNTISILFLLEKI